MKPKRTSTAKSTAPGDSFFLPDFCNVRMVFAIVIIGELLAIVLALSPLEQSTNPWNDLSVSSLFIQWVGLTSAGLLCISRPWLSRLTDFQAATISYLIPLLDTIVMTEVVFWITALLGEDTELWHFGLLLRNLGISAIISAVVLRYFYVQHQWKNHMQSESRARIQALQARIRPHFLFNSLNTIASLTRDQPARAEQAIEDLSDLFRGSLAEVGHLVTLDEEFDLAERYLNIEKLRLGDRLQLRWKVDELPRDALVPQLTLQPLLENAIYHGIEPAAGGGVIGIDGHLYGDQIYLTVSNPLPPAGRNPARKGHQLAQENVRQRLTAIYGTQGDLNIQSDADTYHLTVILPYWTQRP